eukprot:TRINITY_DN21373_c0_g1_i1.p1 TRINITY_DN21373_c0_g1~~TRINITY_DN21373_c0_g1_i1.p1  ORF type:complete len:677 (-),score=70.89 TRINITY_DN21373_c0_g1_i1:10-2040(-)
MLPRARKALAGTYFAEQVASASYDLVCVTHADHNSRPTTSATSAVPGQGGCPVNAKVGQMHGPPGSGAGRRRGHNARNDNVKCTTLPALNNIDSLLNSSSATGSRKAHDDEMPTSPLATRNKCRMEVRARHSERIRRTAARLCRGEMTRRRNEDVATPGDAEALASLTQPLPYFTQALSSGRENMTGDSWRSSPRRTPRHSCYQEAVQAGLARTDYEKRPRSMHLKDSLSRQLAPKVRQNKAGRRGGSETQSMKTSDSVRSLLLVHEPVVPEDPVGAYFNWEKEHKNGQKDTDPTSVMDAVTRLATETNTGSTPLATPRGLQNITAGMVAGEMLVKEGACSQPKDSVAVEACAEKSSQDRPSTNKDLAAARDGGEKTETVDAVHNQILDSIGLSGKMSQLRKEASQSLRMFIFGNLGNDSKKSSSAKDIDRILRERVGSKPQVQSLYTLWSKLDGDQSGSVDIVEFRQFVEKAAKDILDIKNGDIEAKKAALGFSLGAFDGATPEDNMKFAQKLCERVGMALLGKKSSFVVEDLIRIIWPCSQNSDLKIMRSWCKEFEMTTWRTPTPRQLPKAEFEALAAVFRFFDNDGSGTVTTEELVQSGLIDKEQAHRYVCEVDGPDGDGELSMLEFCELFCPTGYRAHSRAKVATDELGRPLVFDARLNGWRLEDVDPGIFN